MMDGKRLLKVQDAANLLCVATQTLRNWERTGLFKPDVVYESGHRRYDYDRLIEFRNSYTLGEISDGAVIISSGDVCKSLSICTSTLKLLEKRGKIKPVLVIPGSGKRLYLEEDIEKYKESLKSGEVTG